MRVKRHNNLVKFIANLNVRSNETVLIEPGVQTASGLRKPDLIIKDGAQATVVDIQIVGNDKDNLNTCHKNKVNYYKNNVDVINFVKSERQLQYIIKVSSSTSFRRMLELDIIKKSDVRMIIDKVLLGGVSRFKSFYSSTFK